MAKSRDQIPELKAGLFLSGCFVLLMATLFIYGKADRSWRDRRNVQVVFNSIGNLRPEAQVQFNGLEMGRVQRIELLQVSADNIGHFPPLSEDQIEYLPLTEDEKDLVRDIPVEDLDRELRKLIIGRTMVVLSLDLLAEADAQRYRVDDQVRIGGTILGEPSILIVSGTGPALDFEKEQYLIGASGDMYTDLSKSLTQVKNIMRSLTEMVGGGGPDSPMRARLANFGAYTKNIEDRIDALETELPGILNNVDRTLESVRGRVSDAGKSIENIKPELIKALDKAEKKLAEMKTNISGMTDSVGKQVKQIHERATRELAAIQTLIRENKKRIPNSINEAYEFTERMREEMDKVDRWMTQSDRTLTQGVESTRQALQGIRSTFDQLEEKLWYLARYPALAFSPPTGLQGMALHVEWRQDLMKRHFMELRGELERARAQFKPEDASDQERLDRVNQLVNQLDSYLSAPPKKDVEKRPVRDELE